MCFIFMVHISESIAPIDSKQKIYTVQLVNLKEVSFKVKVVQGQGQIHIFHHFSSHINRIDSQNNSHGPLALTR